MSPIWADDGRPFGATTSDSSVTQPRRAPSGAGIFIGYGATLLMTGAATLVGMAVERLVGGSNLALVYVLPVVIAATAFGLGPSLVAVAAGVLCFDFFFTEPRYSLAISSPSDLWAVALLGMTASIVSAVAALSRRRALEADRAAAEAWALQALAHAVIQAHRPAEIAQAAAAALSEVFQAPAAIFALRDGELTTLASAQGAIVGWADEEAARGAIEAGVAIRAETYPFEASRFDVWPITGRDGRSFVVGVDFADGEAPRPDRPERLIEVVGAYLSAGFDSPPARPGQSA